MLINKNYDLKKNHGYFVHFNMLKDTLLKVGKIDTSTIAADVDQIDKVGITKDNAKISYINDSGQNKTYTVNFFNEYVQDENVTNRLVSQYFTYKDNSLFQITLNFENGQTKVINVPDEINKYIKAYFGTHITLNNNPVNSIAFSDNSFSVNSENESKSFDLSIPPLSQNYFLSIRFYGKVQYNNAANESIKIALKLHENYFDINGYTFSTFVNSKPFYLPFESLDGEFLINEKIFKETQISNRTRYVVSPIGTFNNESNKITLNKNIGKNRFYVLSEQYEYLDPHLEVQLIDMNTGKELSLFDNISLLTRLTSLSENKVIKLGDTGHFISFELTITPSGNREGSIYLTTYFDNWVYEHQEDGYDA